MRSFNIFWQFSRPHTMIGSFCSITALYIMACRGTGIGTHLFLYAVTLISALACNIFIVGVNQVADVEMDRINKPYLPLAAGTLSRRQALAIIYAALVTSLFFAWLASLFFFLLIIVILLIGMAYSLPPLYLKQHHLPAALAITLVRGLLVNLGIFLHFQKAINGYYMLPGYIYCLAVFIMAFSIAIAWFKDLPDTTGDQAFQIKTLAILYSGRTALRGGMVLVSLAYVYVLIWSYGYAVNNRLYLVICHAVLFILFLLNLAMVKQDDKKSIVAFYLRFWGFFFAEYMVFAGWFFIR